MTRGGEVSGRVPVISANGEWKTDRVADPSRYLRGGEL